MISFMLLSGKLVDNNNNNKKKKKTKSIMIPSEVYKISGSLKIQ